jgi:hypothetical protein
LHVAKVREGGGRGKASRAGLDKAIAAADRLS